MILKVCSNINDSLILWLICSLVKGFEIGTSTELDGSSTDDRSEPSKLQEMMDRTLCGKRNMILAPIQIDSHQVLRLYSLQILFSVQAASVSACVLSYLALMSVEP